MHGTVREKKEKEFAGRLEEEGEKSRLQKEVIGELGRMWKALSAEQKKVTARRARLLVCERVADFVSSSILFHASLAHLVVTLPNSLDSLASSPTKPKRPPIRPPTTSYRKTTSKAEAKKSGPPRTRSPAPPYPPQHTPRRLLPPPNPQARCTTS
jgi:hypothetical protein